MTSVPLQHYKRTISGPVLSAFRSQQPAPPAFRGRSYAKNLGIKFQKQIEVALRATLEHVEFQPHFRFENGRGAYESIFPDALIPATDHTTIVEIKLRHSYDGWSQLTRCYLPVVECVYPGRRLRRLEICKNYDPQIKLPEPTDVLGPEELESWLESPSRNYGILIWGR